MSSILAYVKNKAFPVLVSPAEREACTSVLQAACKNHCLLQHHHSKTVSSKTHVFSLHMCWSSRIFPHWQKQMLPSCPPELGWEGPRGYKAEIPSTSLSCPGHFEVYIWGQSSLIASDVTGSVWSTPLLPLLSSRNLSIPPLSSDPPFPCLYIELVSISKYMWMGR